ncbi:MAG: hypothetical protein ACXWC4_14870 [Telluria sp.]
MRRNNTTAPKKLQRCGLGASGWQQRQAVVQARAPAFVVAGLHFAAGIGALRIDAASVKTGVASAEGHASRRGRVGAGHAGDMWRDALDERLRQAALFRFGPVERDAEGLAAGTACEAWIVGLVAHGAKHDSEARHEKKAARRFIAAARLLADVAVLNQVQAADAVLAPEAIQLGQHCGRVQSLLHVDVDARVFRVLEPLLAPFDRLDDKKPLDMDWRAPEDALLRIRFKRTRVKIQLCTPKIRAVQS